MKLKDTFKRIYNQLRGLLPSPTPVGRAEFSEWADSIKNTYALPTGDDDSIQWTLATMLMHLGPSESSKPKYYFVKVIRAGAAKQVASAVFYDIKNKQAEAASKAAAHLAATTTPEVVADVAVQK